MKTSASRWPMVVLFLVLSALAAGGQDSSPLSFVKVPAEKSGLTHKIKVWSKKNPKGIKYPWLSPLVDINGDGNLDICYYGHHSANAAIWLGNGDGTFKLDSADYASRWNLGNRAPLWWHVNRDRFIDAVLSQAFPGGILYLNDGTGHWKKTGVEMRPSRTWYGRLMDSNADGHHDELLNYAFVPSFRQWKGKVPEKVAMKAIWKLEDVIPWPEGVKKARGAGFGIMFTSDLDGDFKDELFVYFKTGFIHLKQVFSYVLTLRGEKTATNGGWRDTTAERGLPRAGALFPEDWDGDGDLDVIDLRNGFWYVNDGKGHFTKSPQRLYEPGKRPDRIYARVPYYSGDNTIDMLDLDNNGRRDLVIAGQHGSDHGIILNLGPGKSVEINGIPPSCIKRQFGDVDNDGDLDYVAVGGRGAPSMVLFRNDTKHRGLFLRVLPDLIPEQQLGCRIWVYAPGHLGQKEHLLSYRECFTTNSPGKAMVLDGREHVGIGGREVVDIRVRFPSGKIRDLRGVKAGSITEVRESAAGVPLPRPEATAHVQPRRGRPRSPSGAGLPWA